MMLLKKKVLFTALILLVVNLITKIMFLDKPSIAWDEPFSIYHAQMQPGWIVHHLFNGNNPPGFDLLLHCWTKLFGISAFSVRFLPFLFSSLTAMMFFLLGNRFFNYRTGLVAALIFSFSNYHLFFAHEARVYSLFGFLTVTSFYLFFDFIRIKNKRYLLGLAVINALLLYMHYFGFFVILVQGISVLAIAEIRKNHFFRFAASGTLTLALFLPNLLILFGRFSDSASNGTWIEKPNGLVSLYNMLWSFSNQPVITVLCLLTLVAALVKLIIRKDLKGIQAEKKVVAIWFLFPFFFMFLISYKIPVFLDRYLIFVSFGYYLLVAISIGYLFSREKAAYIAAAPLVLLFAVTFRPNLDNKRHVIETIDKVRALKDENTSVIICGRDFVLNFAYYYDPKLFRDVDQVGVYDKMIYEFSKRDIFAVYHMPTDVILKRKVIYLDAAADFSDPGNNILNTLNSAYTLKQVHHFETIFNVYEFELKASK